jgi:N-acetyl-alpha-D-glucosaminyl L-malate synthase BshA
MRIGIVCYPTYGGSGVVATELGKALASKGHQVHFITYKQPIRLATFQKNIFYHEVTVSDYPLFEYQPYELVLTSKIVDVALYENLDLLHVHYAIPHASAAYMAREILKSRGKRLPFITTLHGTDITLVGKDASFEPVITFAIKNSDAVTAVSESLRSDTLKHFSIENGIKVIPNFVCFDSEHSSEEISKLRKELTPNNERLLIHISNFRPVKRVEDVVKVFSKVREKMPTKLIMIGDGPERRKVEELCRQLNTCSDIKFFGNVKDPDLILKCADLFLLTSEIESFGLAALEAMSMGVPVISTNTGGIPEVNKHGVSGYLSNVGDVEDMSKNAISILSNDETLMSFKEKAFNQAKQFDIKKILPLYEDLYNSLLK